MKTSLSSTLSLFSPSALSFFSSLSICCAVPVFSFVAQSESAPPAGKPSILCLPPAVVSPPPLASYHVSDFCQHLLREAAPRSIDGCPFSPKVLLYLLCFSLVTGFWVGFLKKEWVNEVLQKFWLQWGSCFVSSKPWQLFASYGLIPLRVWRVECVPPLFKKKCKGIFWYF